MDDRELLIRYRDGDLSDAELARVEERLNSEPGLRSVLQSLEEITTLLAVEEFVASCRRAGIEPGIYLGTRWNSHLGLWDFRVTEASPLTQAAYNRMIEAEVAEICSRYGPLFELWFDGGAFGPAAGGPDVQAVFERWQPDCLFYHSDQRRDARWGGSGCCFPRTGSPR